MRHSKRLIAFALMGAVAGLPIAAPAKISAYAPAAEERAIRKVIADMEAAWNRGNFRGYMGGFLNPGVVFVSRGCFQRDWQGTLDLIGRQQELKRYAEREGAYNGAARHPRPHPDEGTQRADHDKRRDVRRQRPFGGDPRRGLGARAVAARITASTTGITRT